MGGLDHVYGTPNNHTFVWIDGVVTELPSLNGIGDNVAWDVNNRNQIVGQSGGINDDLRSHAVLWENGAAIDLGTLGGYKSTAVAINNKGQIIGQSTISTESAEMHSFLYTGDGIKDIGAWTAYEINDSGVIVGSKDVSGDFPDAVYVANETLINLGIKGKATAVNNKGQIVGTMIVNFQSHGFLWDKGKVYDLGTDFLPTDINESGQVVGRYLDHAVIWKDGALTDLGTLGGRPIKSLLPNLLLLANAITDDTGNSWQTTEATTLLNREIRELARKQFGGFHRL